MKKLTYILKTSLVAIVLSTTLNSCEDWLELFPEGETLLEDYWKSGDDIEAVLMSCYRSMQEPDYLKRAMMWGQFRSDDIEAGSKTDDELFKILDVNIQSTNSWCNWASFYTTINLCNTVLYYAPGVLDEDQNLTPNQMDALCAEAKAIRALSYFYLVRTYRDVPLVTRPTIDDSEGFDIAATPELAVLDTIINDLEWAKTKAQTTFGSYKSNYNHGRFTKQSIRALLSDVYLWKAATLHSVDMGQAQDAYRRCVEVCDEFIAYNQSLPMLSRPSLLTMDMVNMSLFIEGLSDESVFELVFSAGTVTNTAVNMYGTGKDQSLVSAPSSLYDPYVLFGNTDARRTQYLYKEVSGSNYYINPTKYIYVIRTSQTGSVTASKNTTERRPWVFYRIPDIYLNKAEALVEIGAQTGAQAEDYYRQAVTMCNYTYKRGNPSMSSIDTLSSIGKSYETMQQLVLDERRREFLFEGKRWFDIMRYCKKCGNDAGVIRTLLSNKQFPMSSSDLALSKMPNMDALYLPYPFDEVESNKLLEQNPFYKIDDTSQKN